MPTTLTPNQRLLMARALLHARRFLCDGVSPRQPNQKWHICWALGELASSDQSYLAQAANRAQVVIMDRLRAHGVATVEAFLKRQLDVSRADLTDANIQAYRRAWMELLAEEFSQPAS